MSFKKLNIRLIVYLILLILLNIILGLIIMNEERFFSIFMILFLDAFMIYEVSTIINHNQRDFKSIVQAIKNDEFNTKIKKAIGTEAGLSIQEVLGDLNELLRKAKIEREAQYQYLKIVLNSISSGVITLDNSGNPDHINRSAFELFGMNPESSYRVFKTQHALLIKKLQEIKAGQSEVYQYVENSNSYIISINRQNIRMQGKDLTIFTMDNIQGALDQKEIKAYLDLTRILAHEIRNSITPLSSLSETSLEIIENAIAKNDFKELQPELNKIKTALNIIQKRTSGIYDFVNDFRALAQIPKPQLNQADIKSLLDHCLELMESEFEKNRITVEAHSVESKMLMLDSSLIEQVMINVLSNAVQAINPGNHGVIEVFGRVRRNTYCLQIKDNGKGIDEGKLDKVFIPFFSTKENGSGIGLSISKNIMNAHGGYMRIHSIKNEYTLIEILFPLID